MREYRFEHQPAAPAGRVVFEVANRGRLPHEMTLVRLPPDYPATIAEQLRAPTRRAAATIAIVFDQRPGERRVFAADLLPGRYGFICFMKDADGQPHSLKGMTSEFQAG